MATATVTGALLAGGASRRMGRDKRSVEVEGVPMARRVASALATVADEVLVVASAAHPVAVELFDGLSVRLVIDARANAGPLAGLEAALGAARHELVLVAAADMPWLAPPLLRMLVVHMRDAPPTTHVAVVATKRGPEPLLACYRRGMLPVVSQLLDAGQRRLGALLAAVSMDQIPPAEWRVMDPSGRSVRNLNEPADLLVGA
jgi:molybdenum cofactor guanylyltransferase